MLRPLSGHGVKAVGDQKQLRLPMNELFYQVLGETRDKVQEPVRN
jgi:hypothetical protein